MHLVGIRCVIEGIFDTVYNMQVLFGGKKSAIELNCEGWVEIT